MKKPKRRRISKASHLRQSKTDDFLHRLRKDNSMVEYFMQLRILNPASQLLSPESQTRREGAFVRLAHAREEFTAPILTKGKAVLAAQRERGNRWKKGGSKPK